MKELNKYIFALIFTLFALTGVALYAIFSTDTSGIPEGASGPSGATTTGGTIPTPLSVNAPVVMDTLQEISTGTNPLSMLRPATLLSAGTGTTTLRSKTPFNDILIAESGSEFASLRNARYSMWPYPGEIRFKEIYLILPDAYEPVFPGYSNNQFIVSSDGTKQVMLYLRNSANTGVGADTEVYVQAPIPTDEADQPMTLLESANTGATYSIIKGGEEVLIEIRYKAGVGSSPQQLFLARAELLRAIEKMEIIW